MDALLDVEFLECDPRTVRDGETPVHLCVKHANERDAELGAAMAKMAIDAGCDPRVRDKLGRTPRDLVHGGSAGLDELKDMLAKEEYIALEGLRHGHGASNPEEEEFDEASDSDA